MILSIISLPFADFSVWFLVLLLILGFVGLTFGGDWLTVGAAAVSVNLKISPVVVGLTVVSMATSMPEMMTSLLAAKSSPGLALGNILGSNVANIGFILGVTALITPLAIQLRMIQREVPILIGVTALFILFAVGGFSRIEGILMFILMILYLFYIVRSVQKESAAVSSEFAVDTKETAMSTIRGCGYVLLGGLLLALGADVLIGSSVEVAGRLGVSETLIGLTIVAIGTSLPELAASISAAKAGHGDMCAGNIVGSNLFNILLIGGGVAMIIPIPVDPALFKVEFPALLIVTCLLLVFFRTGHLVTRKEGVSLLVFYVGFLVLSGCAQMGFLF